MEGIEQHSNQQEQQNARLMARNISQIELAEDLHEDVVEWIGRYAKGFDRIVSEDPNYLDRLANEYTHGQALEEIKSKLYH